MTPADHLASIKERLLTDPIVASFQITRERTTPFDGHLRARLILVDGSRLEFSEYVQRSGDAIGVITYSYNWTDAEGALIKRWDNAPHHIELPGFPDHVHFGATGEVTTGEPMNIFAVLDEVAVTL
jgi:hypothetical protein